MAEKPGWMGETGSQGFLYAHFCPEPGQVVTCFSDLAAVQGQGGMREESESLQTAPQGNSESQAAFQREKMPFSPLCHDHNCLHRGL